MRTITTNLYLFSELSKDVQNKVINNMRESCYQANSEIDWLDAEDAITQVEEIANVNVSIQQSSQGFYVDHFRDKNEEYELTDEQQFEQFRKNFLDQYKESMWCDYIMLKVVEEWQFEHRRSYAGNVAWMIVSFCEKIEHCCLSYFDDDCVKGWIDAQDFEFTEDGKLYQ